MDTKWRYSTVRALQLWVITRRIKVKLPLILMYLRVHVHCNFGHTGVKVSTVFSQPQGLCLFSPRTMFYGRNFSRLCHKLAAPACRNVICHPRLAQRHREPRQWKANSHSRDNVISGAGISFAQLSAFLRAILLARLEAALVCELLFMMDTKTMLWITNVSAYRTCAKDPSTWKKNMLQADVAMFARRRDPGKYMLSIATILKIGTNTEGHSPHTFFHQTPESNEESYDRKGQEGLSCCSVSTKHKNRNCCIGICDI